MKRTDVQRNFHEEINSYNKIKGTSSKAIYRNDRSGLISNVFFYLVCGCIALGIMIFFTAVDPELLSDTNSNVLTVFANPLQSNDERVSYENGASPFISDTAQYSTETIVRQISQLIDISDKSDQAETQAEVSAAIEALENHNTTIDLMGYKGYLRDAASTREEMIQYSTSEAYDAEFAEALYQEYLNHVEQAEMEMLSACDKNGIMVETTKYSDGMTYYEFSTRF